MRTDLALEVASVVKRAERCLKSKTVQARNPMAAQARKLLVRQLWAGDRVLAYMRDGGDWGDVFETMTNADYAARRILKTLRTERAK